MSKDNGVNGVTGLNVPLIAMERISIKDIEHAAMAKES